MSCVIQPASELVSRRLANFLPWYPGQIQMVAAAWLVGKLPHSARYARVPKGAATNKPNIRNSLANARSAVKNAPTTQRNVTIRVAMP